MYPIFTIFIFFALFTFVFMNRSSNAFNKEKENFLEKEREANSVRKQPLTDLEYINVDLDSLPSIDTDDPYILERLTTLKVLSDPNVKIVNLSSFTNTELKLKYGVSNLTVLTEYDQNFTNLCRCLFELGRKLYELGDIADAKTVLEYGIKCNTDLKSHYTLLADIYEQNMQYKDIVSLVKKANTMNSALKGALIADLNKRLEGTNYSADEAPVELEDIHS